MITILIEPVRMTKRGQLYRTTYLDWTLCAETLTPVVDSCRELLKHGITGRFETRKPGITYPCMVGDVRKAAELVVYEGPVRFSKGRTPKPLHP